MMPWFRHRAHFGTRPLFELFWFCCDADDGVNCLCFSLFVVELIEIDSIFAQIKWNFNCYFCNTRDGTCSLSKIEMQTKWKCNRIVILSSGVSNSCDNLGCLSLLVHKAYQEDNRLKSTIESLRYFDIHLLGHMISNVCPALTLKSSIQIIDEAHASFRIKTKQSFSAKLQLFYFCIKSCYYICLKWGHKLWTCYPHDAWIDDILDARLLLMWMNLRLALQMHQEWICPLFRCLIYGRQNCDGTLHDDFETMFLPVNN